MLRYLLEKEISGLQERVANVHIRSQRRLDKNLGDLRADIAAIRRDLEELALFAKTTAIILIEKGIVTDQEFVDRMTQIDREDGVEDGRLG